jgi:hypothetical protein
MTNLISIFAFLIISAFASACSPSNTDNCFDGLDSITAEPVSLDTLVLFDPKTFAETCFLTYVYLPGEITPDSILEINDKVVSLVKSDACFVLYSVKQEIEDCN